MTSLQPIPSSPESFSIPEDNDDLLHEVIRLAGHINAAEYRLLKLIAEVLRRASWASGWDGFKTPAHWLNWSCGIDLGAAREKVRVAKCLGDFPLIDEAFRTGTISYSKVRAMTRAATPENEEFLLKISQYGTASHLERMLRKYNWTRRMRSRSQTRAQHEAREFSWYVDDDGMFVFKGKLPPEDGALLQQAVDSVFDLIDARKNCARNGAASSAAAAVGNESEAFPRKRGDADPGEDDDAAVGEMDVSAETSGDGVRNADAPAELDVSAETPPLEEPDVTFPQKRADALVLLAETALSHLHEDGNAGSVADKYQVMVHLEPDRLGGNGKSGHGDYDCSVESQAARFPVSAAVARRLACDAGLVPVLEDGAGNVLNIGRKSRTVPPAIRRALVLRDKGCRFPGCCQTRFVDAHHIHHWCDGGETSLDNLVLLCRHHHRLLHQEGFRIEKRADGGLRFVNPDGERMPHAPWPQFPEALDALRPLVIEGENVALGIEIRERTALTKWDGSNMDYDMALHALWTFQEQTDLRLENV